MFDDCSAQGCNTEYGMYVHKHAKSGAPSFHLYVKNASFGIDLKTL